MVLLLHLRLLWNLGVRERDVHVIMYVYVERRVRMDMGMIPFPVISEHLDVNGTVATTVTCTPDNTRYYGI